MDYYLMVLILIAAGFGSGLIVGIGSGTAGGIMIPVLTVFLGRHIHDAIGTSLILDTIIGGIAGSNFLRKGNVDIKSGIVLAISGMIGALVGSRYTSQAPESLLNLIIGIGLIILGTNFIINGIRRNVEIIHSKISFKSIRKHVIISFIILGFLIGLLSGFSGIGGGGFVAIILVLVLAYNVHVAIGTSLIMLMFIAGTGSAVHIFNNEYFIDGILFAGISAGFGAVIGSSYANKINEDKLGRIIGLIIVVLGVTVILKMLIPN
jgi:uncharacterized membrane protein YfcA